MIPRLFSPLNTFNYHINQGQLWKEPLTWILKSLAQILALSIFAV